MTDPKKPTENNGADWPRPALGWYAVSVLLLAYIFSFVDRTIIALMIGPIKQSLNISDTQFSILHGIAFTVFYTFLGVPIGKLADQVSRKKLIAVGVAVWSMMTAVCGLATSFLQLFLARTGVGVGEATLSPAAYSMIADYFPKDRLGRALGVYMSGAFLGAAMAFLLGGALIQLIAGSPGIAIPFFPELQGWRLVFMAVGAPGLLIALLMMTVMEPSRRGVKSTEKNAASFREVLNHLSVHKRVFLGHFLGFSILVVTFQNVIGWGPAYFMRHFGLTPSEAGYALGSVLLVFSSTGVICGGVFSDWLVRRGTPDGPLRVGVYSALLLAPCAALATTLDHLTVSLALFCPMMFLASASFGAAPAALQMISPARMRGQISAIFMLFLNLLSFGVGPFIVALVTDMIFHDEAAVGYSLAIVSAVSAPIAAGLLWSGSKPFCDLIEVTKTRSAAEQTKGPEKQEGRKRPSEMTLRTQAASSGARND